MRISELQTVWAPRMLSVLRIVVALVYLEHGTQKLLGFPVGPNVNMPAAFTLIWFGGIIETVGGLLILFGLFTRAAAFITSGETAFAYFLFHIPRSFFPALNGGIPVTLDRFVFLYFVFAGAGPWSLDAYFRDRRSPLGRLA